MWSKLKLQLPKTTTFSAVKRDKFKTLIEMVSDYGYPIEKHFYTTADGYINCVHRIPGPIGTKVRLNSATKKNKKPVVIY